MISQPNKVTPKGSSISASCIETARVYRRNAEAIKWFRLAAGQGFAIAQYNLGLMYANGLGP
jgi:TPR repeat protein